MRAPEMMQPWETRESVALPMRAWDSSRKTNLAGGWWLFDVRMSQARRHVVYAALRNGAYFPWDFQPLQQASERYMRNHMDLNVLEESKRFPRGE